MARENEKKMSAASGGSKWKRNLWLKVLIVVLALLLVLLLAAGWGMSYILGRLSRFEDVDPEASMPPMTDEFDTDSNLEGIETMETVDATDVTWDSVDVLDGDAINIMLIGQDRRPGEVRSRSDSMILVTLNKAKNSIQLTSFMRDTYLQIPGYLDNRLNVAYRFGGVELMNETFLLNFGIEIDGNVMVDFDEFKDIIKILGGVDIEMNEAEVKYMRKNIEGTFEVGMNHLDKDQALCFTRMRYAAGGDYGRTDRQRRVLVAIGESLRDANLLTIFTLIDDILPHITTNIPDAKIIEYATAALGILGNGGELQTMRIPQDDAHKQASIRNMSVLVPDLEKCREDLQEFLYEMNEES